MLKIINNSIERPKTPPPIAAPPPPWDGNDAWWDHARKQPNFEDPMPQQRTALQKAWYRPNYALFHAMGLGKTFTAINLAAGRFATAQVEALVVICPTGVKNVWPMEIDKWCPIKTDVHVHMAGGNKDTDLFIESKTDKMKVLIFGVEALSQGNAHTHLNKIVLRHKTMIVLDESDTIKSHNKIRTKKITAAGQYAKFKLIMTGTEVSQGIHDLYSQFRFLHEKIIGHKSYFGFRATYCMMGGFQGKEIIGYANTDALMARLSPFVDIVSKAEAMPWLPPKTYEQRFVDPTPEQKRVMLDLKDLMETEYKGEVLTIDTVLERLTRYQQIVGGNYPFEVQDDKGSHYETRPFDTNPKMGALLEVVEEMGQDKVIIWARFKPELRAIAKALEPHGEVVEFHGDIDDDGRKDAVQQFQFGSARFMVSNQAVGGVGQTWTAASKVIYYSNTFSYRDRMQSEDRCHRKGTVNPVVYVDITMNHAIDRLIAASLRNKEGMATYVKNALSRLQNGN